ncbi:MAG: site-specific DNA-methyltransferase [Giesbergeria sp.]|uniref:site-specific DNA-methyltransferase n=1 Tax=Giesbergeria sp. TaxID=2818473 RepID=UPI00261D4C8B|nr:site-specific DNA-methyltransferase [Giesbergeria sp.]MDD2608917.1 site-specific DNA-methyltransferase [Giesbergeria sp.]
MPTLNWLNREQAFTTAPQVPYRLLEPVSRHGEGPGLHDNVLIQGDNLEALKALLPFYRGQVKCIFIDPPYNTKSAFEHYDDNLEHSQWLSMMLPRLQLLRDLLREDGSIWVTIDDNEGHYLKVLMDEVFGRRNFVANVFWEKKFSPQNDAYQISINHDHVLVYAKRSENWRPNLLPRSEKQTKNFKNPDNDPRGPWLSADYTCAKTKDERPNLYYAIQNPFTGQDVWPSTTRVWAFERTSTQLNLEQGLLYWGANGNNERPRLKKFPDTVQQGMVPTTFWRNDEVGNNQDAKKETLTFNAVVPFATPKPERLIERVLTLASNPGDLVLDSFLGSGTTAAVAHKMGRRWIGIEMGEHAATHCLPRLQKVIAGEQGGISTAVGWQGGGGFGFFRLGAPIFGADGSIHPEVRFATLAAFVWQQETGTAFSPQHGQPSTPYLGTYAVFDNPPPPTDPAAPPAAPVLRSRTAYYLLFNGILGDKRPASGNVLTLAVLDELLALHARTAYPQAPLVVYGEACRLGDARLAQARITFKHIPYDVKAK